MCSPEIAASFAEGVHFNTFGGNPVACTVASSVLDVSTFNLFPHQSCTSAYSEQSCVIFAYFYRIIALYRDTNKQLDLFVFNRLL